VKLTDWFAAVEAAGTIVVAINLVFFVVQLRLMGRQIGTMETDSLARERQIDAQIEALAQQVKAQNLFELHRYLEQEEHLQARARVTKNYYSNKPYRRWSRKDKAAADVVARLWTMSSIWERMGVLPDRYLQRHYGPTILRHWKACEPYIHELRKKTGGGARREFEEMALEVESLGWFSNNKDNRPDPLNPPVFVRTPGTP
jgi:hypothetical protein